MVCVPATEGTWVGKADVNFMNWTGQKYKTISKHSGGVTESYEYILTCLLTLALQFQSCEVLFTLGIYLLLSELAWFLLFFLNMLIFIKINGVFFVSKLEGADMSVRRKEKMLFLYNIYFVSGVWLLVRDFWRWVVFGTWFLGAQVPLVSSSNRKWQEASQQIQTLQASQSLLVEYEQKIKVRNFVTYIKL